MSSRNPSPFRLPPFENSTSKSNWTRRSAIAPPPRRGRRPRRRRVVYHTWAPCPPSTSSPCAICGRSSRPSGRSSAASTSPSSRARRSACSARTAPGSRRCSASWPAWTRTSSARRGRPTTSGSGISRRSRGSIRRRRSSATSRRVWPRPATSSAGSRRSARGSPSPCRTPRWRSSSGSRGASRTPSRPSGAGSSTGRSRWRWTPSACRPATRTWQDALGRRGAPRGALPAAPGAAGHAAPRRADQPPRRRIRGVAGTVPPGVPGHGGGGHARPLLPRQRGRLDPGARPRPRHPLAGELLVLARAEAGSASRGRRGRRPPASEPSSASWSGSGWRPAPGRRRARRASPPTRPSSSRRSSAGPTTSRS